MAEKVQQNVELMLPELEQLCRVGLFSSDETKQILKKRKAFEYRLQRRTKVKEDYLYYIQYENDVLSLIRKRRERNGYTFKKQEIDVAIIQRIHRLFRIVTYRFQDDVKLWLSHIKFAKKEKERTSISKLFTRMLQVHNKKPELWILAAKWEFEENLNPETARNLFQRGLRFNSNSKQLWIEYFRMELMYTEKTRKRIELLNAANITEEEDIPDALLDGAVAYVVYVKAVEESPDDVEFLLSFLQVAGLFEFTKELQQKIISDSKERFGDRAETWNAVANRHLLCAHADAALAEFEIKQFHKTFQQGLRQAPSRELWEMYLGGCLEILSLKCTQKVKVERIHRALDVFNEASDNFTLTEQMFGKWVDVLSKIGLVQEADNVLELATTAHSQSASLWQQWVEFLIVTSSTSSEVTSVFRQACQHLKEKNTLSLWRTVLDYSVSHQLASTEDLFEKGMKQPAAIAVHVKELYLQWIFLSQGIAKTRDIYKKLVKFPPVSLELIRRYISIETSQAKPKIELLRKAFEDGLMEFGSSDCGIWIDYIQLELSHPKGQPSNVGKLHFRAVKSLSGEKNQEFITHYTLLQTGSE